MKVEKFAVLQSLIRLLKEKTLKSLTHWLFYVISTQKKIKLLHGNWNKTQQKKTIVLLTGGTKRLKKNLKIICSEDRNMWHPTK